MEYSRMDSTVIEDYKSGQLIINNEFLSKK